MEISNLIYKGFKVIVIKVLTDLRRTMDGHSGNFNDTKYKKVTNRGYD